MGRIKTLEVHQTIFFYIQAISKQKLGGGVKHFTWEATGGIWDEAILLPSISVWVS